MKTRESLSSRIFDSFNIIILILFALTVVIPFIHVIAISLSSPKAIVNAQVTLWPVGFSLKNYMYVMKNSIFFNSFKITLIIVILGTAISMLMTLLTAYPLSRVYLPGRKVFILILVITLIFQSPMVPLYLVVKMYGLLNTIWALILPFALSVFNTFICITFFKQLPNELFEAARIDGMTEYGILFKIVVPLSKPVIVTLLLFFSVSYWNSYQSALYYITNPNLRPLQLYLWSLVAQSNVSELGAMAAAETAVSNSPEGLMMATVITATIPIIIVYPFLQKHFMKGILTGSLKG